MFGILHAHSVYSQNDSTQTPEDLVIRTKELGYKDVTLTDHGTLLGIEEFLEAGERYGINAIPGMEAYLEDREHLLLIAKDEEGYRSIRKASREANENITVIGRMKFPCMKEETLLRHFKGNDHVIVTSACISGPVAKILLKNHEKNKHIKKYLPLKNASEQYAVASKMYQVTNERLKEYKKELTQWKKYTKPAFLEGIAKLEEKLALDPNNEKIRSKLEDKRSASQMAKKEISNLELEIAELKIVVQNWKKLRDENEAKAKRYHLLPADSFTLIPEEELFSQAKAKAIFYKSLFPYFYLELQYHGLETEKYAMPLIAKIAKETGIPLIAANDAHITRKEDAEVRSFLQFNYFERHQETTDSDRELYMKSEEELEETLCKILPLPLVKEAIANTSILSSCHIEKDHGQHYPVYQGQKTFDKLIEEGKLAHMSEWDEEHESRLQREVQVIKEMGYIDYHMIVTDYCKMMKKLGAVPKHELVNMPLDYSKVDAWLSKKQFRTGVGKGPGRGSAVGSLVCYLLGITELDPIKYGLLFDRYLNPERVSMPDIDTDVKTSLRPYIIRYLSYKYGSNAVASIMTKNTYGAKEAINTSGRDRADELYGTLPSKEAATKKKEYLYQHTRQLGKMVPEDPGAKLSDIKEEQIRPGTEEAILLERAKKIEGIPFATGVHAGGVVITDGKDMTDYLPVQWREDKRVWACEADMLQVESRGLLKMDILGLSTLDCISDCLQMIETYHGEIIDINKKPFEDEVFLHIFSEGRTNSVFQFESAGMKSMLKRFRPSSFEDLVILVAMFRPGPMQYIDDVIDVKHKRKALTYITKELEPILSKTYGAIVYQEQVMQIFQSLAGYSLGQADLVRRAMSKKKEEKLQQERTSFIYGDDKRNIPGCKKNGIDEKAANRLFDDMLDFARYAFNKSHAASYALVAYQTAWLKYHFPAEFLCAMFNNKAVDKFGPIHEDCRLLNVEILPPDINRSAFNFCIENGKIRYGLSGIKGINEGAAKIIQLREGVRTYQPFLSIKDFFLRCFEQGNGINKKEIEKLIYAGCFDCFVPNRKELFERYEQLGAGNRMTREKIQALCTETFVLTADSIFNREQEVQLLGNILSDNPLKKYKEPAAYGCATYHALEEGRNIAVMGLVTNIEEKKSSKGNDMIKVALLGKTGSLGVLFMNQSYQNYKQTIHSYLSKVVKIQGRVQEGTFFANTIRLLPAELDGYYLILDTLEKTKYTSEIMREREKGDYQLTVEFHYDKNGNKIPLTVATYSVTEDLLKKLRVSKLFGTGRG